MSPNPLPIVPKRILVINVARIGDTILMVPVLRALREAYPKVWIECQVHPKRLDAIAHLPLIDRWGGITKRSAPWRGRFGKAYDLVLVFGRELALLDYALRIGRHVVALPTGDARRDRQLHAAVPDRGPLHAVYDRLRWLDEIGVPAASLRLDFGFSDAERAGAERWIDAQVKGARPLVGFQIASFPTKAYRNWPLAHFAELGRRILADYPAARILVLGDTGDRARADELAKILGERCLPVAGQFTLRESAALMQRLDLYVGVDTGPTHLAGALGVPMVALYHCLHRGRFLAPLDHPAYLGIVDHPAADEEAGEDRTMSEIDVDAVWPHVVRALAGATPCA